MKIVRLNTSLSHLTTHSPLNVEPNAHLLEKMCQKIMNESTDSLTRSLTQIGLQIGLINQFGTKEVISIDPCKKSSYIFLTGRWGTVVEESVPMAMV